MELSPAVEYGWLRDGPRKPSKLICHEDRTESATLPQSLHGASRCYPRRRVPRSGARHPGAASAKTSNPGPSPSHSRTDRGGGILPPLQSTEAATAGRPEDSEYRRKVNQLQTNVFDQLPLLLAVPRAAAILGISRAAAYRLAASGELPVRRLGGRVYVVTAELRELVAS
jgi:predicted DNA-binding transcriptional regulator AlpA